MPYKANRLPLTAYVVPRPTGVTRTIQPAGCGQRNTRGGLRWRDGVAIRIPGNRLLLIVRVPRNINYDTTTPEPDGDA